MYARVVIRRIWVNYDQLNGWAARSGKELGALGPEGRMRAGRVWERLGRTKERERTHKVYKEARRQGQLNGELEAEELNWVLNVNERAGNGTRQNGSSNGSANGRTRRMRGRTNHQRTANDVQRTARAARTCANGRVNARRARGARTNWERTSGNVNWNWATNARAPGQRTSGRQRRGTAPGYPE